ncbi:MAG: HaeIII family restriction endonuclease [Muribaculaceae bacterium]|nr:HaeIII family restriction endonuclease [Muribaculaceae bacterium]
MSSKSNDQGRAYEFISLLILGKEISEIRPATIIKNSSYTAAENAWNTLSDEDKNKYTISAKAAVKRIFDLEPRIIEDGNDEIELFIQPDQQGEQGDVRDILIVRRKIAWEIGLSLKHNHHAVKHSRLSHRIDFGKIWYGIPCSKEYWDEVLPIFGWLAQEKVKGTKFSELPSKENDVYVPILNAFIKEINKQYETNKEIPSKMVEYLLGKFDFYKVISVDDKRFTRIQGFNLHGTLNQYGVTKLKPSIEVPLVSLPTRIVKLDFVPGKTNTVELYMDEGWQFSFRIHNAKTNVEPSLKFDIQIVGMPTAIITINCIWD